MVEIFIESQEKRPRVSSTSALGHINKNLDYFCRSDCIPESPALSRSVNWESKMGAIADVLQGRCSMYNVFAKSSRLYVSESHLLKIDYSLVRVALQHFTAFQAIRGKAVAR